MRKGDIVLVPFPFTDLSGQKIRPSIVLHSSEYGEDCIVAFISSIKEKKIQHFEIPISASGTNGLKVGSVIKVDKIATLQKMTVLGQLGTLEPQFAKLVNAKLKILFRL